MIGNFCRSFFENTVSKSYQNLLPVVTFSSPLEPIRKTQGLLSCPHGTGGDANTRERRRLGHPLFSDYTAGPAASPYLWFLARILHQNLAISARRASARPGNLGLAQDLPFDATKGHLEQSAIARSRNFCPEPSRMGKSAYA